MPAIRYIREILQGSSVYDFVAGTQSTYSANNLNQYSEITSSESSASFAFNPIYDAGGNATLIRTSTGTRFARNRNRGLCV